MSLWLIILLSAVATLVVGGVLGYLAWKTWDKVDDWADSKQEALLPLYTQFARAGVKGWFLDLLKYMVSGNEEMLYQQVMQMVKAENTPEFFDQNIAEPIAKYWNAKKVEQESTALAAAEATVAAAAAAKKKA